MTKAESKIEPTRIDEQSADYWRGRAEAAEAIAARGGGGSVTVHQPDPDHEVARLTDAIRARRGHDVTFVAIEVAMSGALAITEFQRRHDAKPGSDPLGRAIGHQAPPWFHELGFALLPSFMHSPEKVEEVRVSVCARFDARENAAIDTRMRTNSGEPIDFASFVTGATLPGHNAEALLASAAADARQMLYLTSTLPFLRDVCSGKLSADSRKLCARWELIEPGSPPPSWYVAAAASPAGPFVAAPPPARE